MSLICETAVGRYFLAWLIHAYVLFAYLL